ncbi:MAG TPA: hypothetical protein VJX94_01395 [Stellaceae bacterium]|nr:hypothetical protein [Stellaceae bacterium]
MTALDTLGWKILFGVSVAIGVLGVFLTMAGLGIIGWQCYFWLSWGYWSPLGVRDGLGWYDSTGWLGLDKLINQAPLSLVAFVSGCGIAWVGVACGNYAEEKRSAPLDSA